MIISVVIPLYNKADTVTRAVRSVLAQTRLPDVLVVVDDGSTDGSAEVCLAAMADAPTCVDCRLIVQVNAGVSVARNVGAEAVSSDVIAFLDADDEWLPEHMAELERLTQFVPEAGLLSTRHARLTIDGRPAAEPSALPAGFFGRVENGLAAYRQGYGILHTSCVAVSRESWSRSGGFLPGARKSQDIHLWLRLLLTEPFAHSDACTVIWHEEATGVARRTGAVPAHFTYFLCTPEGREQLSNYDLRAFLATNLASHVGGHRLRFEDTTVNELLKLSGPLPMIDRLIIRLIAKLPRVILEWIAQHRRQARTPIRT